MIGLGSANLGIGIAVHLRNNFSNQAGRVTASMRNMTREQKAMLSSNLAAMRNMGAGVALVGLGIGYAMNSAIKEVAEFDHTMQAVKANASLSTVELRKLKDEAISLGEEFGVMPQNIAEAMKDVSKAVDIKTLGTRGLYDLTKNSLLLARVGDTDVGGERGSSEILINIMSQFEMQANRSLEVVDKLAMAANKTTTDVKGLAESFKYGGAEAHRLGLSLDETLAFFGIMGQAGLKGSLGGTTAGNFLRYLTKAAGEFRTERQSQGLAMIGLKPEDIMDAKGNLLDLTTIFTRVQKSIKGMNTIKRQNAMEAIFGVRGSRAEAVLNMLDKANFGSGFKELLAALQKSKGYAQQQMAVRMETYQARMDQFKASLFGLKEAFVSTIVPVLIPVLGALTKVIKGLTWFVKTPMGKFVVILVAAGTALMVIGGTLAFITGLMGNLLLTSKATFRGMVRAARWAFRMMGLEALIFNRKATGSLIFNEGLGRWINGRNGRMVSGKLAERYNRRFGGGGGMFGGIMNMLGNLLPFLPMGSMGKMGGGMLSKGRGLFGMLGGGFRGLLSAIGPLLPKLLRFGGLIGLAVSILLQFVDVADVFKGIGYVLGTIFQALYQVLQFINPWSDTFLSWDSSMEAFQRRNYGFRQSLGWEDSNRTFEQNNEDSRRSEFYSPHVSREYMDKQYADIMGRSKMYATQKQTINVVMDSKKISSVVQSDYESLFVDSKPVK